MEAKTVNVEIPMSDWSFFVDMAKQRGWKTTTAPVKSGIDIALEELKAGEVYHAKDADEVLRQILG